MLIGCDKYVSIMIRRDDPNYSDDMLVWIREHSGKHEWQIDSQDGCLFAFLQVPVFNEFAKKFEIIGNDNELIQY